MVKETKTKDTQYIINVYETFGYTCKKLMHIYDNIKKTMNDVTKFFKDKHDHKDYNIYLDKMKEYTILSNMTQELKYHAKWIEKNLNILESYKDGIVDDDTECDLNSDVLKIENFISLYLSYTVENFVNEKFHHLITANPFMWIKFILRR